MIALFLSFQILPMMYSYLCDMTDLPVEMLAGFVISCAWSLARVLLRGVPGRGARKARYFLEKNVKKYGLFATMGPVLLVI